MSAEQNKALVRRFLEARVLKPDLDVLDEILTLDFVSRFKLVPDQQPGREGYKQVLAELLTGFSNRRFLVEKQIAEGDMVVTHYLVARGYLVLEEYA